MLHIELHFSAGCVPEGRFVEYFVEALRNEDNAQFNETVEQFMEAARGCREGKLADRKAAEDDLVQRLEQLEHDNQALASELDERELVQQRSQAELDAVQLQVVNASKEQQRNGQAAQMEIQQVASLMAAEKLQLEAAMEDMRRAALLRAVYHEFDLDGGGDVGAEELMEVGQARRRLGQKSGEWTEANNRALMRKMGPDEEGIV